MPSDVHSPARAHPISVAPLATSAALSKAVAASQPEPQRPESPQQLPPDLRNVTAVLTAPNPGAPGGRTLVYVLGMSHVSKRSLDHIDQLITLVREACQASYLRCRRLVKKRQLRMLKVRVIK